MPDRKVNTQWSALEDQEAEERRPRKGKNNKHFGGFHVIFQKHGKQKEAASSKVLLPGVTTHSTSRDKSAPYCQSQSAGKTLAMI